MPFTPKNWIDGTTHEVQGPSTTNISAAALEDLETRVTDYADTTGGATDVFDVVSYGADPTGATYSDSAFDDALDAIRALPHAGGATPFWGGAILHIPNGTFKLASTLSINRGMIVQGVSGSGWYSGSELRFDDGVDGIVIERTTTSADGGPGDWSVIRDLAIRGAAKTVAGADGVLMKARAKLENCWISDFSGSGIHIDGGTSGHNANCWRVDTCRVDNCGQHGISVHGGDSNAGTATMLDCSNNDLWGFYESSFLGNAWVGCHAQDNGAVASPQTSTLNGAHSASVTTITLNSSSGFDTLGGVVKIDTDWISYTGISGNDLTGCDRDFAGTAATHSNGATVTQRHGGFMTNGLVNNAIFLGCYTEGGQPSNLDFFQNPATVFGYTGNEVGGSAQVFKGYGVSQYIQMDAPTGADLLRIGEGGVLRLDDASNIFRLTYDNDKNRLAFQTADTTRFAITGSGDGDSYRSGFPIFPGGFLTQTGNKVTQGTDPTGSNGTRGDIVYNNLPSASGMIGWVCTATGTPGTWKTFGAISA